MKNSLKGVSAVGRINFQCLMPAYIVTAAFLAIGLYNIIAGLTGLSDNTYIEMSNYLYVLAVMAPIIIETRNFKRLMHLNGDKKDFYWGVLLDYCILAAAISLFSIIVYVLTGILFDGRLNIIHLMEVFGWWQHGVIIAFIRQLAFLLLVEVFVHTLTSIQGHWYGWLIDAGLIAILCIFIPLAGPRKLLVGFFHLIIFHENALIQISSCIVLTAIIYILYRLVLQRKEIR